MIFTRFVASIACALAVHPAIAQQKTVLRYSSAAPPADFLARSQQMFKTDAEKSVPALDVQVFPGSQLFRQGTEVPAMQRGNLEMSTMTTFEVAQQIPEYGFFNRAYLFRDYEHAIKVFAGPLGKTYADTVAAKMGIVILAPTYLALQTGTIDGQENPPTIMNAAKFHEVTKQLVITSHLVQPIFVAIAKPFWDKLTTEQRTAVQTAAVASAKWNDEQRLNDEKTVIDGLAAKGLTVVRPDLAAFRANADKIYSNAEAAKPWDRKMMDEVMRVR